MSFYSIRVLVECNVSDSEGKIHLTPIVNDMRPNLFFEGEYYPSRVIADSTIPIGCSGRIIVHLIPVIPLVIKVGSMFELRAADKKMAECVVVEVLENRLVKK